MRQTWLFNNFLTHLDSTGLFLLIYSAMVRWQEWGFMATVCCGTNGVHKIVWAGRDLKDQLVPTPLVWAGTPSSRAGWSMSQLTWPCYLHNETLSATSRSILYLPSPSANKPRCLGLSNNNDFFYSFTRVRKFGSFFASVSLTHIESLFLTAHKPRKFPFFCLPHSYSELWFSLRFTCQGNGGDSNFSL